MWATNWAGSRCRSPTLTVGEPRTDPVYDWSLSVFRAKTSDCARRLVRNGISVGRNDKSNASVVFKLRHMDIYRYTD